MNIKMSGTATAITVPDTKITNSLAPAKIHGHRPSLKVTSTSSVTERCRLSDRNTAVAEPVVRQGSPTIEATMLQRLLDVPDKGAKAEVLEGAVFLAEGIHNRRDLVIRNHCQNSVILLRPSVIAIVWDAIDSSPALDVQPLGEASLAVALKQLDNLVAVGLIV